jgi:putative ABC transport system permease protein
MNTSAIIRKARADVMNRPGRTFLAILGIMIGILGLTAINVASEAVNAILANGNDRGTSPNMSFSVFSVDPTLSSTLAKLPNVLAVQIDTHYQTRWHVTTKTVPLTIIGYQDLRHIRLSPFRLTSGRLPGDGEIVMEESDSQIQPVAVGDMVTVDTAHGPIQLRVTGLTRTPGLAVPIQSGVTQAYMTSTALSRLTGSTAANTIDIKLDDQEKANATARAIANVLQSKHITTINVSLVQGIAAQSVSNSILSVMRMLSLVALLLTAFLVVITITAMIAEQTRIIGIMKAIGGTQLAIMRGYLLSVFVYGLIGTILGIGLGIVGGYDLASFMLNLFTQDPGPLQVPLSAIVPSVIAGPGVPVVAALYPLWSGTRITVYEAMGAYGVTSRDNASHNRSGQRLTLVPQTVWLSVRGIFRKRGRTLLTLLALTLAGVVFLSVQTTIASFDQYSDQFSGIYHDDVAVTFARPQSYEQVRRSVLAIPNVGRFERYEADRVNTQWGRLELIGVEATTRMYNKHLLAGRWFAANENNVIVISQVMANKSGLKVGDTLVFSNALNTVSWHIIGEVSDPTNPVDVGVGLTPIGNYAAFAGLSRDLIQGFIVQGVNRSPQAVQTMAGHLDTILNSMGLAPSTKTEQEKDALRRTLFTLVDALFYVAEAVVACVGILGVFNTLTTSVLERRREIGVLRSLGATNWRVVCIFWLEGVILAMIAWMLGVVLGIPGAYGFVLLLGTIFIRLPVAFNPFLLLNMLSFIIIMVLLASVIPVFSAVRVRIAEMLRYE